MILVYHGGVATALVLSAGGLFAAWEAGVWKALARQIRPDMVVGASAGAWNAWAIAGGATADELAGEWRDPRLAGMMRLGPRGAGLLRSGPLHARAREMCERFRPRIPFGCVLVEVPSLRLRLVREGGVAWRHLAATCSIPFAFPPVKIEGRWYVDGGLRSSLPVWAAEEMGATCAIAVNCLTSPVLRAVRAVMRPPRPSPKLEVLLIEPSVSLGPLRDAVVWSPRNIERWIGQGERDANRVLTSVRME
jgi:NTE family protein